MRRAAGIPGREKNSWKKKPAEERGSKNGDSTKAEFQSAICHCSPVNVCFFFLLQGVNAIEARDFGTAAAKSE
jgi:hypothetical protein